MKNILKSQEQGKARLSVLSSFLGATAICLTTLGANANAVNAKPTESPAFNIENAITKECSSQLQNSNPSLNAALSSINSFEDVRRAVNAIKGKIDEPIFCVSGAPVSQNKYGYKLFLISVDIYEANAFSNIAQPKPAAEIRFLYQDASVQAYHNNRQRPWIGIDPSDYREKISLIVEKQEFKKEADFKIETEQDVLDLALQSTPLLGSFIQMNEKTLSVYPLDTNSLDAEYYLVSYLTKSPANVSSNLVSSKGVLVRKSADGRFAIAESVSVHDIALLLQGLLTETYSKRLDGESDERLLLRLSTSKQNN